MGNLNQNQSEPDINLDCGRPVSFSYYDDLIGISLRYSHPTVPDPEVSYSDDMLFYGRNSNQNCEWVFIYF